MKALTLPIAIGLLLIGLSDAWAGGKPENGIDAVRGARFADVGASHRPGFLDSIARHFDVGAGFKYEKSLTLGERPLVFKLRGPVHRKRLGLGFQIRF